MSFVFSWANQVSIKVHEPSETDWKPAVTTREAEVQTVVEFGHGAQGESYETDDENDANKIFFPDPAEFQPQSPDFTFPPLPPTPPELDETETITSSTILKTAIEVLPAKLEEKKKLNTKKEVAKLKKEVKQESEPIQKVEKNESKNEKSGQVKYDKKEKPSILVDKKSKHSNMEKKRQKKETFHHLKVPQVQLQVSSEREIVDSIVVIKNKAEKKEEKLARKSKRRKEKRDPDIEQQQHLMNCNECQEDKIRKRREREMIRSDDIG